MLLYYLFHTIKLSVFWLVCSSLHYSHITITWSSRGFWQTINWLLLNWLLLVNYLICLSSTFSHSQFIQYCQLPIPTVNQLMTSEVAAEDAEEVDVEEVKSSINYWSQSEGQTGYGFTCHSDLHALQCLQIWQQCKTKDCVTDKVEGKKIKESSFQVALAYF